MTGKRFLENRGCFIEKNYFAKHLELRSTLPRLFRELVNAPTLSKIADRQGQ